MTTEDKIALWKELAQATYMRIMASTIDMDDPIQLHAIDSVFDDAALMISGIEEVTESFKAGIRFNAQREAGLVQQHGSIEIVAN